MLPLELNRISVVEKSLSPLFAGFYAMTHDIKMNEDFYLRNCSAELTGIDGDLTEIVHGGRRVHFPATRWAVAFSCEPIKAA